MRHTHVCVLTYIIYLVCQSQRFRLWFTARAQCIRRKMKSWWEECWWEHTLTPNCCHSGKHTHIPLPTVLCRYKCSVMSCSIMRSIASLVLLVHGVQPRMSRELKLVAGQTSRTSRKGDTSRDVSETRRPTGGSILVSVSSGFCPLPRTFSRQAADPWLTALKKIGTNQLLTYLMQCTQARCAVLWNQLWQLGVQESTGPTVWIDADHHKQMWYEWLLLWL